MKIIDTDLAEIKIIECDKRIDNRGSMSISLDYNNFLHTGIDFKCVQQRIYHAPNKHTFFGIHFQDKKYPQAKMIQCIKGKGIDYIVDLKKESPTYKKWIAVEICGEDELNVYIPHGYGHAFLTLEDNTIQLFSINEYFHSESAKCIRYNDPEIGLHFPVEPMNISEGDIHAPYLKDIIVGV